MSKDLEERIKALELEVRRLNDYNEIQRLMGKYMTCHIRSNKEGVLSQRNQYLYSHVTKKATLNRSLLL